MKFKLLFVLFIFSAYTFTNAQGLPSNPEPGKCYVKCITKDEFKEVTETIEVSPAYKKLKVIPATYKLVDERVIVKEATKKLIYVPAVYETVQVSFVKKEKGNDLVVNEATFGEDSKTFEVYPATSGWEYKVLEDCPSVNKEDCVAACFVEYPPKSQTVEIKTLVKDAFTTDAPIDEQKDTYTKKVVKTPPTTREVEIPAVYKTIKRRVVDQPAKVIEESIPAKFETVTRTMLTKKGGITTWEEVNCELLDPNLLPIFYALDSAKLSAESKRIIDERIYPVLKDSNVSIEIMSHTDSRADDAYNKSLSQQRANSVVNYLVSKGISRSRLAARGYGETRLTNRCSNGVECSEAEHQKNRRTEFRVINTTK